MLASPSGRHLLRTLPAAAKWYHRGAQRYVLVFWVFSALATTIGLFVPSDLLPFWNRGLAWAVTVVITIQLSRARPMAYVLGVLWLGSQVALRLPGLRALATTDPFGLRAFAFGVTAAMLVCVGCMAFLRLTVVTGSTGLGRRESAPDCKQPAE